MEQTIDEIRKAIATYGVDHSGECETILMYVELHVTSANVAEVLN
jgi:hypothetical protein